RALDEQRTETRAVDEEVALDPAAVFQQQRGDVVAFAVQLHLGDLALAPRYAIGLGNLPQEAGVETGVEVVGVVERRLALEGETVLARGLVLGVVGADRFRFAARVRLEPEVLELGNPGSQGRAAEGVQVAVARTSPVLERDAELEARLARPHERLLVDLEQFVKRPRRRYGRLAHSDRADLLGFDQRHLHEPTELPRERNGGDPPGRAAAGNDHAGG